MNAHDQISLVGIGFRKICIQDIQLLHYNIYNTINIYNYIYYIIYSIIIIYNIAYIQDIQLYTPIPRNQTCYHSHAYGKRR